MTKQELSGLSIEDLETLNKEFPRDYPGLVFLPGRYYVGMWYMILPVGLSKLGKGGNVTALLWRYDHEPTTWQHLIRFRHYNSPDISDPKDLRSWIGGTLPNVTEEQAFSRARDLMRTISGSAVVCSQEATAPLHYIDFRGDNDKALAVMKREKPFWWHVTEEISVKPNP